MPDRGSRSWLLSHRGSGSYASQAFGLSRGWTESCFGRGFGPGLGGYGGFNDIYGLGLLYGILSENVPYHAAFPPVYYSAPVPRTYGYSPFAYPPGVMTPEIVEHAQPLEIINPHMEKTSNAGSDPVEDKVTITPTTPEPLVVINPYVTTRVAER